MRKYNAIDKELVRTANTALKATVPQKQHGYANSPVRADTGREVLLWKSILSSIRNIIPIVDEAYRLAAKVNINLPEIASIMERTAQQNLNKAQLQLKEIQANAEQMRATWLASKVRYNSAVEGDDDEAKTLEK